MFEERIAAGERSFDIEDEKVVEYAMINHICQKARPHRWVSDGKGGRVYKPFWKQGQSKSRKVIDW